MMPLETVLHRVEKLSQCVPSTSQSTLLQRDSLGCSSQERESVAFASVTAHPSLLAVPQLPARSATDHSLATSLVPQEFGLKAFTQIRGLHVHWLRKN
nr:unnamed protein product [Spirometra erinaceieuropaei]